MIDEANALDSRVSEYLARLRIKRTVRIKDMNRDLLVKRVARRCAVNALSQCRAGVNKTDSPNQE